MWDRPEGRGPGTQSYYLSKKQRKKQPPRVRLPDDLAAVLEAVSIVLGSIRIAAADQFPNAPAMAELESLKLFAVPLASVATEPMQTAMIKASITAYSTAVGPSSSSRKLVTACFKFSISLYSLGLSAFGVRIVFLGGSPRPWKP